MLESWSDILREHGRMVSAPGGGDAVPAEMASSATLDSLLDGFVRAVDVYQRKQIATADGFNLLGVLGVTLREDLHSNVLAWLLDHDMSNFGTHAQGSAGFRLFLKSLGRLGLREAYATCRGYWVRREEPGADARIDVEVACRGQFLIHIENKIHAGEGLEQTKREWADIQRRARDLGLDPDGPHVHPLFLTPCGDAPEHGRFHAIPWSAVAQVMEQFATVAQPPTVRLFASHYAAVLRSQIARTEDREGQDHNGEATAE